MPKLAKIRRRGRKTGDAAPKRNPPLGTDIAQYIAPGFAAFAATRLLTRIVAAQIAKRYPKFARHAGAMASAGAFAAAWFGAHRVKQLEKYHHPIVVGSGLAALQSVIQLYLPKIGQALDVTPPELAAPLPAPGVAAAAPQLRSSPPPIPEGFTQTDANTWYSYNDSFDAGSYKDKVESPLPSAVTPPPDDLQIDDLLDNSDLGLFS
jgi:hypothetical protein